MTVGASDGRVRCRPAVPGCRSACPGRRCCWPCSCRRQRRHRRRFDWREAPAASAGLARCPCGPCRGCWPCLDRAALAALAAPAALLALLALPPGPVALALLRPWPCRLATPGCSGRSRLTVGTRSWRPAVAGRCSRLRSRSRPRSRSRIPIPSAGALRSRSRSMVSIAIAAGDHRVRRGRRAPPIAALPVAIATIAMIAARGAVLVAAASALFRRRRVLAAGAEQEMPTAACKMPGCATGVWRLHGRRRSAARRRRRRRRCRRARQHVRDRGFLGLRLLLDLLVRDGDIGLRRRGACSSCPRSRAARASSSRTRRSE